MPYCPSLRKIEGEESTEAAFADVKFSQRSLVRKHSLVCVGHFRRRRRVLFSRNPYLFCLAVPIEDCLCLNLEVREYGVSVETVFGFLHEWAIVKVGLWKGCGPG